MTSSQRNEQFDNIVLPTHKKHSQHYLYIPEVIKEETDNELQQKYQALDRKCEDYISKHLQHSEELRAGYDRYKQNKILKENKDSTVR